MVAADSTEILLVAMVDAEWVVFGWSLVVVGSVSSATWTRRKSFSVLAVAGETMMELRTPMASFCDLARRPCTRRRTVPSSKFGRPVLPCAYIEFI